MRKFWAVTCLFCFLVTGFAAASMAQEPRVLVSQPPDGAVGVPIDLPEIKIFFSQPMNTAHGRCLK